MISKGDGCVYNGKLYKANEQYLIQSNRSTSNITNSTVIELGTSMRCIRGSNNKYSAQVYGM